MTAIVEASEGFVYLVSSAGVTRTRSSVSIRVQSLLQDIKKLKQLVVENVLAFNEGFWIWLAARAETCKSNDDKKDYEELAASVVMSIVDRLVHKANEKIESATDILKAILRPVVDGVQEVSWPPEALKLMEEEVHKREQMGQLDEAFLAEGGEVLMAEKFLESIIEGYGRESIGDVSQV